MHSEGINEAGDAIELTQHLLPLHQLSAPPLVHMRPGHHHLFLLLFSRLSYLKWQPVTALRTSFMSETPFFNILHQFTFQWFGGFAFILSCSHFLTFFCVSTTADKDTFGTRAQWWKVEGWQMFSGWTGPMKWVTSACNSVKYIQFQRVWDILNQCSWKLCIPPPIPLFLVHYPSSAPLFTFQEPWCTEPCIQKLKRMGCICSFIWKSAALWLHRFNLKYLVGHCTIADHICTSLLSLSIVKLRGKYLQINHTFSHMSECISVSAREVLPRWRCVVPAFSLFVLNPPRYWRSTCFEHFIPLQHELQFGFCSS